MQIALKRFRLAAVAFICGSLLCGQMSVVEAAEPSQPAHGGTKMQTKQAPVRKKAAKKGMRKAGKAKKAAAKKAAKGSKKT
jgi:hypothetical protein